MQDPPSLPTHAQDYLRGVSSLAARSFQSTAEATQVLLDTITEQIGLRTRFLTQITPHEQRNHVLAASNRPGGCDIQAGIVLPLQDTF